MEVARDPMDVCLDRWGFPVEREPSSLGSALLTAFIFEKGNLGESEERVLNAGCSMRDSGLARAACRAKRVVADHDFVAGPLTRDQGVSGCAKPGCRSRLHPMEESSFETWLPPVETRLLWETVRGLPDWHPYLDLRPDD